MRSIAPWRYTILSHIVDIPVAPAEEQTVFQVTYSALAPVIEYVTPSPVVEFIAPAPSVTHVTPSEQFSLSPEETAEVVQVMPQETVEVVQIGFVHPPGSMTVKSSASHVVGSLLLLEEFATPVHQEQIACEQIVHVPIPQVREQIVEGVKEISQELFPEQTVEQIIDDS